jgi:hypothetical protein
MKSKFPFSPLFDYAVIRGLAHAANQRAYHVARTPEWDRLRNLEEDCADSLMVRMDSYGPKVPYGPRSG